MNQLTELQINTLLRTHCEKVIDDMPYTNLIDYATHLMMKSFEEVSSNDIEIGKIDLDLLISDIWFQYGESDDLTIEFISNILKIDLSEAKQLVNQVLHSDEDDLSNSVCHFYISHEN